MANRYANLVGSNKIKDEWQKINQGFDAVQAEMDQKADRAFAQVNDLPADTKADTITFEGGTGITITTNPNEKKVTVTATGTATPGAHGSAHTEFGADPIPLATPTEGGLMSAADKAKLDGATYAATAGTLVQRDSSGRFKAAAPSASDDVARKAETDAALPKAGGTMTGTLNMGGNIISNAQELRLQHGTRLGEDSGQRTRIHAESDRFDVITEDGMNYILTARYDGTLQFRGQNIWRMDQLRWNPAGYLEYNDGGTWKRVIGFDPTSMTLNMINHYLGTVAVSASGYTDIFTLNGKGVLGELEVYAFEENAPRLGVVVVVDGVEKPLYDVAPNSTAASIAKPADSSFSSGSSTSFRYTSVNSRLLYAFNSELRIRIRNVSTTNVSATVILKGGYYS